MLSASHPNLPWDASKKRKKGRAATAQVDASWELGRRIILNRKSVASTRSTFSVRLLLEVLLACDSVAVLIVWEPRTVERQVN